MSDISVMTVKLTKIHPKYDGEYEIDLSKLKNRDIHTIKRLSGLRPFEYGDAFAQGDTDWVVGLAAVVLQKAGIPVVDDVLWEATAGQISLILPDDDEGDVGPPAVPLSPAPDDDSEKSNSSGPDSENTSESPETTQSPTGLPPSDTGAESE